MSIALSVILYALIVIFSNVSNSQFHCQTTYTGPPIAGPTGKGPTGPPPTATPDTQTGGIQASAVAGITLGVIILVALLLIATVIGFSAVWWVYRRRTKSARAAVSFATQDYTDETNVTDLDDMVGESV